MNANFYFIVYFSMKLFNPLSRTFETCSCVIQIAQHFSTSSPDSIAGGTPNCKNLLPHGLSLDSKIRWTHDILLIVYRSTYKRCQILQSNFSKMPRSGSDHRLKSVTRKMYDLSSRQFRNNSPDAELICLHFSCG